MSGCDPISTISHSLEHLHEYHLERGSKSWRLHFYVSYDVSTGAIVNFTPFHEFTRTYKLSKKNIKIVCDFGITCFADLSLNVQRVITITEFFLKDRIGRKKQKVQISIENLRGIVNSSDLNTPYKINDLPKVRRKPAFICGEKVLIRAENKQVRAAIFHKIEEDGSYLFSFGKGRKVKIAKKDLSSNIALRTFGKKKPKCFADLKCSKLVIDECEESQENEIRKAWNERFN